MYCVNAHISWSFPRWHGRGVGGCDSAAVRSVLTRRPSLTSQRSQRAERFGFRMRVVFSFAYFLSPPVAGFVVRHRRPVRRIPREDVVRLHLIPSFLKCWPTGLMRPFHIVFPTLSWRDVIAFDSYKERAVSWGGVYAEPCAASNRVGRLSLSVHRCLSSPSQSVSLMHISHGHFLAGMAEALADVIQRHTHLVSAGGVSVPKPVE